MDQKALIVKNYDNDWIYVFHHIMKDDRLFFILLFLFNYIFVILAVDTADFTQQDASVFKVRYKMSV